VARSYTKRCAAPVVERIIRPLGSGKCREVLLQLYELFLARDRSAEVHSYAREGTLCALIATEHAVYLRRRKKILPKHFVPQLPCKRPQGLRRPRERLPRFFGLSTLLVKLADPALDLPEFLG